MLKPLISSRQPWSPKSYQKRAIHLLLSQASGGLLLDPGLGKTSVVLAGIKILREMNLIRAALVVAPRQPMILTWPDELAKWEDFADLSYTIVHGKDKAYNLGLPRDIYLINPEGLPWLFGSDIGRKRLEHLDLMVVDESTKFKNSQTQRFKLLKPLLPGFKRRWILTGKPLPNGLEDLFGQIYILDLGRSLGRFITHYRKEYFQLSSYNLYDWQPKPGSFEKVVEKISPLVLRMCASDYLEMPELVPVTTFVKLPAEARKVYDDLDNDLITEDHSIVAANRGVVGVKLRQVANGAVYLEDGSWGVIHDEKLEALEGLLEQIGPAPVLLLYEFNHDRERICKRFPGFEILGGGLSDARLNEMVGRFNSGELSRLAGHPQSMGHGLNLQGSCRHIIWFGIPWDLDLYDQAVARVYRQGQKAESVFVYHISAKDTKDEEVTATLNLKTDRQKRFLEAVSLHRRQHYGED